jgi:CRISPR system Cascade subunit CasC
MENINMTNNNSGRFVQIHALVSYPPSNLNRDDMGRPKTAVMGGKQRLRISSQSIKRAWRESEYFSDALSGHVGYRTKLLGELVKRALVSGCTLSDAFIGLSNPVNPPMDEKTAIMWAHLIANVFAKVKTTDGLKSEQLVHVSHDEILTIDAYLAEIAKDGRAPVEKEPVKPLLCNPVTDVDIALFGRMIADSSKNSVEAAAQVAHPITIHPVVVEDDYFTAVDDLNKSEEIAGAGHLGVSEYGAGVFYTYVCVNRELLIENLGGNAELANKAIGSLIECVAKIGPKGKQSTFASRVYASYLMVEQGNQQPRSLTAAFMSPLKTENFVAEGISRLKTERDNIERAYGKCADVVSEMSVQEGKGSLADVLGSVS